MIEVHRYNNGITVTGHANYAEHGKDIVCAGVSTLVQTLMWSLDGLTEDVYNSISEPGKVIIRYRNLSANAQLLIDSFFIGIELIADKYPEHVKLTKH